MKLNEKNIFLIDGVGAVLSAILNGVVLPYYADHIGLPIWILHALGLIAVVFAVYSLTCYIFLKKIRPIMLLGIILANSLYCMITALIIISFSELTAFGKVFFMVEILVVFLLILIEVRIYKTSFASSR